MERFDKENKMKHILEELKKTDEFYSFFKEEFSGLIYSLIDEFYPSISPNSTIDDLLQTYAVEILSSTESVIDKDMNYPPYRLDEELAVMNQLILKLPHVEYHKSFMDEVHQVAKVLMVKYYTGIYDLSGDGFRLLELNAKLYNWEFNANLNVIIASNNIDQTVISD